MLRFNPHFAARSCGGQTRRTRSIRIEDGTSVIETIATQIRKVQAMVALYNHRREYG